MDVGWKVHYWQVRSGLDHHIRNSVLPQLLAEGINLLVQALCLLHVPRQNKDKVEGLTCQTATQSSDTVQLQYSLSDNTNVIMSPPCPLSLIHI